MKRLLLCLLLLASSPASADDIGAFYWNATTNIFNALTKAAGFKQIPDQQMLSNNPTPTPNSGTCTSFGNSNGTVYWLKTGRLLTINGSLGCATISGTVTSITYPIPNGWTCANAAAAIADIYTAGKLCRMYTTAGGSIVNQTFIDTTLSNTTITTSGACFFNLSCQTTN